MLTLPTLTTLSLRVASKATGWRSNSTSDPTQHQSPVAAWRKPRPSPSRFLTWIEPAAQSAAGSMLSKRHQPVTESQREVASSSVNLGLGKLAPPVTARHQRAMARVNQNRQVTFVRLSNRTRGFYYARIRINCPFGTPIQSPDAGDSASSSPATIGR